MNWQIIVGVLFMLGGIGNITTSFGAFLFGVLIGVAFILWGLKKKGFLFKKGNFGKRELTEETFRAVGVHYYEKNIKKLASQNPKWAKSALDIVSTGEAGKYIYKYNYVNKPIKLVLENHPNDKNAVAVYAAGELVGYISRDDNVHVRNILKNRKVVDLYGFIGGGEYKVVYSADNIARDSMNFSVTIKIKYL